MHNVKEIKAAALKRDLAAGIKDLERGRYHAYDDTSVMLLAEAVARSGRERLNKPAHRDDGTVSHTESTA
jgi:hypothetical protein